MLFSAATLSQNHCALRTAPGPFQLRAIGAGIAAGAADCLMRPGDGLPAVWSNCQVWSWVVLTWASSYSRSGDRSGRTT